MSQTPDGSNPDDPAEGRDESERRGRLDEDAAWEAIVAHYGDRPELEEEPPPPPPADPPARPVLEPGWRDDLQTEATWEDEGHFVPPQPPPPPPLDPRRKAAWIGLFGAPVLMLVGVVLGWNYPGFIGFLLAGSFIGGFVYLVATMPKRRPGEESGDDGAVV